MVYSARTTPFEHHKAALQTFDAKVRSCFEGFMNTQLGNEHWARAVHAVSNGGVGLRSLAWPPTVQPHIWHRAQRVTNYARTLTSITSGK